MANDIVEQTGARAIEAQPTGSENLLAQIIVAASNPEVDAGKMEAMANLALKLQAHEHEQQFNRDLNAALIEMPVITKAGRIEIPAKDGQPARVQGRFARFEDLNAVVKPILARNNLAITFDLGDEGGKPSCIPVLRHTNGWVWQGRPLSAPIDSSGSKNNTQGVGSTASYLKRYTMCAALNIVVESEDDDGNGGQILMPNERGNLIFEAAQAAADDGTYQDWFRNQSPKDRGWLVSQGHHAGFGGSPLALTAPATGGAAPAAKAADPAPAKSQLESRVEQYEADLAACQSLDELAELQSARKVWAEAVKGKRADLHERILAANSGAYTRLSALSEDGNQDDSPATGGDLFEGDD